MRHALEKEKKTERGQERQNTFCLPYEHDAFSGHIFCCQVRQFVKGRIFFDRVNHKNKGPILPHRAKEKQRV